MELDLYIHEQIIDYLTEDFMDDPLFRSLSDLPRPCKYQEVYNTLVKDIEFSFKRDISGEVWNELMKLVGKQIHLPNVSYACGIYFFFSALFAF